MNTGVDPLIDFDNVPLKGNLGSLQAWDPVTQKRVWEVPMPGAVNGGTMATAGGLVFQGRADGPFVAYAADTGKRLWNFDAQNGVVAPPMTYRVGGKQYVTVIAGYGGGAGAMGTLSAISGQQYHTQMRRVLTFALDGKAALPRAAASGPIKAVADPGYRPNLPVEYAGAKLFAGTCAYCHGAGVVGGGGAPDLRTSSVVLDSSLFRNIVHDGALSLLGMPKFDNLSDQERESIRQYVRARAQKLREIPTE